MMDLRHFKYFSGVARLGSFHRAAEYLHVAQSALSRRIHDLEEELGFPLFDRFAGGIRLSQAGQLLLGDVDRVLAEVERVKKRAKGIARGQYGTLNVGFVTIIPQLGLLPECLWQFRTAHPDIALDVTTLRSEAQLQAIREGTLDAGFLYYRPADSPEFGYLNIETNTFLLGMSTYHRLAGSESVELRELTEEDFVWMARRQSPAYYDQVIAACNRRGLMPRIVQEVAEEQTQLAIVAAGTALCFVNSTVSRRARPNNLTFKPIRDLDVTIEMDLVWRADNTSPVLQNFLAIATPLIEQSRIQISSR